MQVVPGPGGHAACTVTALPRPSLPHGNDSPFKGEAAEGPCDEVTGPRLHSG